MTETQEQTPREKAELERQRELSKLKAGTPEHRALKRSMRNGRTLGALPLAAWPNLKLSSPVEGRRGRA